jgi:prepilin-type N-terminal cleavage/methylation domain-containing protein
MENILKKRLGLKKRDIKRLKKKNAFTLLELLIVVAILAIIGGGMIAAYDGLEENASQASSTRDIAALDQAMRTFKVQEGSLPNNLESLIAAVPTTPAYSVTRLDSSVTAVTAPVAAAVLGSKLAGKFTVTTITGDQAANLAEAGITEIRYIDVAGNDGLEADLNILAADGNDATNVGDIADIDIPAHAFEAPRPGNRRNRGRGFYLDMGPTITQATADSKDLAIADVALGDSNGIIDSAEAQLAFDAAFTTASIPVAVWNAGGGYNNVKVGAAADAVLVAFGIGNSSSLVSGTSDVGLAHAPYYANVAKNHYNHYIALVDVNQKPAKLVAIVDSRGDFLDEEYAESTDQKK